MGDIATLEAEIKDYKLQLETLQTGLQADPDNAELQNLKIELEELISILEGQLAELKPAAAPAPPPDPSPPPIKEKWSKENHPAFQPGFRKPGAPSAREPAAEELPEKTTFAVNDMVLAKWKSGDKALWPAKITSVTGSAAKPVYLVKFKAGGDTETVFAHEIKAIASEQSRKRKAEANNAVPTPPSPAAPPNPSIILAAADINPALASQARKEPSKVSDGPTRPAKVPRKVKANKELEAGKNKWQEFSMKGKGGKVAKKESMFRTGEGVNARVGFTGSGQEMRKDPTRSRHIYQQGGEDEAY